MSKRTVSGITLTLLFVSMLTFTLNISEAYLQSETVLYVDPSSIRVSVESDFTVIITVADIVDLYAFGFCLGYNTAILDVLDVLIQSPFESPIIELNETGGYVRITASLPPDYPKLSGSFALASITFGAAFLGSSTLKMYDSVLIDSEIKPMPHTTIDGSVRVYSSKLLLETDNSVYKLGENITVTLTNIGNETIEIEAYPAWQIFTYPEEDPVYPEVFLYLLWWLEPGENDSITWNQLNGFTKSYVNPGSYVVRDLQGWGLFTYFKIVYAEIIVPDDYPTIQEAVNNAEDGDTVFVRNGTYYEHVVVNRTVSLAGENRIETVIDGDGTGNVVFFEGVNDVTVTGFTIRNGSNGFCMIGSNHTVAENIIVYNTHHGIDLAGSNSCIGENTIANNHFGVILGGSSYNVICRNIIMSNEGGINLDENCARNNIIENTLMNNTMGIGIAGNNNTVVENTIEENWSGIEIGGTDNTIYHNNLIENTVQVYLHNSHFNNEWDDRCEGNYWSDYNGTDSDDDGIDDTPYIIDENNTDHYPLMNPYWLPGDVNHDLKIDIYDVVRITGVYGSQQGDPNWNCHCDIAEPYDIIDIYDVVTCTSYYRKKYTP